MAKNLNEKNGLCNNQANNMFTIIRNMFPAIYVPTFRKIYT